MWSLYLNAQTVGARPSDLLDVKDPYAAYCLDSAVAEWGRAVESALHEVEGKTKKDVAKKSDRVLRRWLDMPQRYRDPASAPGVLQRSEGEV